MRQGGDVTCYNIKDGKSIDGEKFDRLSPSSMLSSCIVHGKRWTKHTGSRFFTWSERSDGKCVGSGVKEGRSVMEAIRCFRPRNCKTNEKINVVNGG